LASSLADVDIEIVDVVFILGFELIDETGNEISLEPHFFSELFGVEVVDVFGVGLRLHDRYRNDRTEWNGVAQRL
jgi:hypothetical protein